MIQMAMVIMFWLQSKPLAASSLSQYKLPLTGSLGFLSSLWSSADWSLHINQFAEAQSKKAAERVCILDCRSNRLRKAYLKLDA